MAKKKTKAKARTTKKTLPPTKRKVRSGPDRVRGDMIEEAAKEALSLGIGLTKRSQAKVLKALNERLEAKGLKAQTTRAFEKDLKTYAEEGRGSLVKRKAPLPHKRHPRMRGVKNTEMGRLPLDSRETLLHQVQVRLPEELNSFLTAWTQEEADRVRASKEGYELGSQVSKAWVIRGVLWSASQDEKVHKALLGGLDRYLKHLVRMRTPEPQSTRKAKRKKAGRRKAGGR